MSSDGGGIGGGAPLGGGSAGTGVAIDGPASSQPFVPSSSDIGSDRGRNKVSEGFPDKTKAARERGDRKPAVKEQADVEGERRAGIGNSLKKAHGKSAQKEAAKASRQPAADPGDTSVAPARFTHAVKESWSKVPAEIQSEVHRAVRELEAGLRQYQIRAQRDYALDGWHNLAHSAGTSIDQYLRQVATVEMALRSTNVAERIAAIEHCLTLAGTDPWQYSQFVNQDTAEARQARSTNLAIGQVAARTEQLGQATANVAFTQMQNTVHQHTSAIVNGFAAAHDDFMELSAAIAAEITADPRMHEPREQRLREAYDKVRSRRRNGSRSISGAPANGSDPSLPARRSKHSSIDEAIRRAASRLGG